jgi:signal transduction histidine kinase
MGAPETANSPLADVQRRNHLLKRLLEVSLVLNANLAIKPILAFIMEATCEITGSEAASVLLYDHNTAELRFAASNTLGADLGELMHIPVPMEGSIAGQILRENRPIIIQDADDDPRIFRPVDKSIGFHTRSLLGVPMHVKGHAIGVLESLNKRSGPWTNDDPNYLAILASHAAVAIQNARQTEALRKAYEDLDKVDKIKNDFIAIASHELRTPLSMILGYASFLKEEAQGAASEHATAVLNSALHLRSLIEDMTNLRYIQVGQVELVRDQVKVSSLILAAQSDLQSLASAKGHHLKVDLAGADVPVSVDRGKISMALINILNNAVQFTPDRGEISIGVEQRSHEVWIKISDSGIGIAEADLEKIFDKFYQVADHMTRQHNGMGLGLAIARGMVEAHGGRVWAESAGLNKGSTFVIALPLS